MNNHKNDLFDYENLKIYQCSDNFKFSLDSILLAEYVEVKNDNQIIVDFCTGNAPIPLILSTKTKSKIYGIEIQPKIFHLAKISVAENRLTEQITLINDNLKSVLEYLLPESVDIVTCNPPYFKYEEGSLINNDKEKAIARHEIETNFEEIVVAANYVLKNKGSLYIVHRPERLEELIEILNKYKFRIKNISFIYSNLDKLAIAIVFKATKNGACDLKVGKPIDISKCDTYKNIFK